MRYWKQLISWQPQDGQNGAEQFPFWKRTIRSVADIPKSLALAWESGPHFLVYAIALTITSAAIPLAMIWVGKLIIDGVVAVQADRSVAGDLTLFRLVALEFFLALLYEFSEMGLGLSRRLGATHLAHAVNLRILGKALQLELVHFENSEFYDKLNRARREANSRPAALLNRFLQAGGCGLSLVGCCTLLIKVDALASAALFVACVPAFIIEIRAAETAFRLRHQRSHDMRQLMYLEYIIGGENHAKDVKTLGLGSHLLERYRLLAEQINAEDNSAARKRAVSTFLMSQIATGAYYGCYGLVVASTIAGRLSVGEMTLCVIAFRQGQSAFRNGLAAVGGMYEDNLYMANLFEYLNIPVATRSGGQSQASPRKEKGIRLEGVGFRHTGSTAWSLRRLSLFIPAGQCVAIVGSNGAGKTTLVKLLTRLYEPTEGRILLDGMDLRDWDAAVLQRRLSSIFQDFSRYQFPVREYVGTGSVEHVHDIAKISRAIERSEASAFVRTLPRNIDSQLGRLFRDGIELSGGQWQTLALARAFVREEADILIFDEPTAALDSESERRHFERFRQFATGKTSILVSHRFSTVRTADHIVVLEKGEIVEQGGHAQLMASGGRYSSLFNLQASGYR